MLITRTGVPTRERVGAQIELYAYYHGYLPHPGAAGEVTYTSRMSRPRFERLGLQATTKR